MTYSDWITALAGFLPEILSNPAAAAPFVAGSRYNAVIGRCIEYAELRIYRDPELDLLTTRLFQTAASTQGARSIPKPSSMVIVEEANLIISGVRTPIEPVSIAFMNRAWPSPLYQGPPEHYAPTSDSLFILGPTPDQAYNIEFYGTTRPNPLSITNTSTPLTLLFPDLFLAASMIFMSGYQKTFGAMSGDPQQGMTWEQYYGELKRGVASEEARKKFQSSDWSAMTAASEASPARA